MRRVILLILITLCCIPFVQAQDIITTKDGKDIQSKILEVNANEVKYKKYNNLDYRSRKYLSSDMRMAKTRCFKNITTLWTRNTIQPPKLLLV